MYVLAKVMLYCWADPVVHLLLHKRAPCTILYVFSLKDSRYLGEYNKHIFFVTSCTLSLSLFYSAIKPSPLSHFCLFHSLQKIRFCVVFVLRNNNDEMALTPFEVSQIFCLLGHSIKNRIKSAKCMYAKKCGQTNSQVH